MPKNSAIGVVLGGLSFVLGFAVVWHIWWLAAACVVLVAIALIVFSSDDDTDYLLPAAEVEAMENRRFEDLARAPRIAGGDAAAIAGRPLPGAAS
jgi:cytochrome o ubiquinol oxidase subunit 1